MDQEKESNPLKARIDSFGYAFKGIYELFKSQPNAKIHLLVASLVVLAGWYFQLSAPEWAIVVLAIGLVLAAEAFNTALEYLTDLTSPGFHPLAGKSKDVSAGAVLICAVCAAIMGLIVFLPKVVSVAAIDNQMRFKASAADEKQLGKFLRTDL